MVIPNDDQQAGDGTQTGAGQTGAGTGTGAGNAGGSQTGTGASGTTGAGSGQTGGSELFRIKHRGVEKEYTREALQTLASKGLEFEHVSQTIATKTKQLTAQEAQLKAMIAELEKGKDGDSDDGEKKEYGELKQQLEAVKDEQARLAMDRILAPAMQKYPDLKKNEVLERFLEKGGKGLVEDSKAGMLEAAEAIAQEKKGHIDKTLEGVLSNQEDPRVKAIGDRAIADFLEGKRKLARAGGENGGAGGAGIKPQEPPKTIAEAAARAKEKHGVSRMG